jgi:ankyrin repeat protein
MALIDSSCLSHKFSIIGSANMCRNQSICYSNSIGSNELSASRSISAKFLSFNGINISGCRQPDEVLINKNNNPATASSKKTENSSSKTVDISGGLLHRACQLFPNSPEIIRSALLVDAEAIRQREKLSLISNCSGNKRAHKRRTRTSEPYALPINIALRNKASYRALKILVDAGADTVEIGDGYEGSTSLSIALKMNPKNVSVTDLLLSSNPRCAMVPDRHQNYPLHVACLRGSSLEVVVRLYSEYPNALFMKILTTVKLHWK